MASFYEVMIERNFSSAHQLRGYKGKCENLHGHNYKIEIFARGDELNNIGLLIDFGDLNPEALVVFAGEQKILIVSDDGARKNAAGKTCKDLEDPAERTFRAVTLQAWWPFSNSP